MSEEILKLYTKCLNFAAVKHKDQRRKDTDETPYINHPIGKHQVPNKLLAKLTARLSAGAFGANVTN
uniref:Uncharacterized protein n=1 Tax=Lutzomyia longipalpis TaxID=7200 RepID=A0A1B0CAY9_LUTLO